MQHTLFPSDVFLKVEIVHLQKELVGKERKIEALQNKIKEQNRVIGALTKKK